MPAKAFYQLKRFYKNRANRILSPAHLRALGRVAAEWGLLEYVLYAHGAALLRSRLVVGTAHCERSAALLQALLPLVLREYPDKVAKLIAALKEIKALGNERNYLLHAGWGDVNRMRGWFAPAQRSARALAVRAVSGGRALRQEEYTAAQIEDLAKRIGDTRIEINRIMIALPNIHGGFHGG